MDTWGRGRRGEEERGDVHLGSDPGGEALEGQGLQGGDVGREGVGYDGQEGGTVTQLREDLALALSGGGGGGGKEDSTLSQSHSNRGDSG